MKEFNTKAELTQLIDQLVEFGYLDYVNVMNQKTGQIAKGYIPNYDKLSD